MIMRIFKMGKLKKRLLHLRGELNNFSRIILSSWLRSVLTNGKQRREAKATTGNFSRHHVESDQRNTKGTKSIKTQFHLCAGSMQKHVKTEINYH